MSEQNEGNLIAYEVQSRESLAEYHHRRRAEAELAALELQLELEAERALRRWEVANAISYTIRRHPLMSLGVGLVGACILVKLLSSRR